MTRPFPRRSIERERARARGARRLLPWSLVSAMGGAAIALAAGGGPRGALALFAVGLVFAAFLWLTSLARCPACGARLPPAGDPVERCARCGARFE